MFYKYVLYICWLLKQFYVLYVWIYVFYVYVFYVIMFHLDGDYLFCWKKD